MLLPVIQQCHDLRALEAVEGGRKARELARELSRPGNNNSATGPSVSASPPDLDYVVWAVAVGCPLVESLYLPQTAFGCRWPRMTCLQRLVVREIDASSLATLAESAPQLRVLRVENSCDGCCLHQLSPADLAMPQLELLELTLHDDVPDFSWLPHLPRLVELAVTC
eukprot:1091282-Prymnesium_polylepis.2